MASQPFWPVFKRECCDTGLECALISCQTDSRTSASNITTPRVHPAKLGDRHYRSNLGSLYLLEADVGLSRGCACLCRYGGDHFFEDATCYRSSTFRTHKGIKTSPLCHFIY